jgi:hypothetical protein
MTLGYFKSNKASGHLNKSLNLPNPTNMRKMFSTRDVTRAGVIGEGGEA